MVNQLLASDFTCHDSTVSNSDSILLAMWTHKGNHTAHMQESALGNEEEQLVSLLLSKGAAESALADEMGRLRVQEDVCAPCGT